MRADPRRRNWHPRSPLWTMAHSKFRFSESCPLSMLLGVLRKMDHPWSSFHEKIVFFTFCFSSPPPPPFFFVFLFFVRVISKCVFKCVFKWKHKYKSTETRFIFTKENSIDYNKVSNFCRNLFGKSEKKCFLEKCRKKFVLNFPKKFVFLDQFDSKCKNQWIKYHSFKWFDCMSLKIERKEFPNGVPSSPHERKTLSLMT